MTRLSWITAAAAVMVMFWLAKDGDTWSETQYLTGQKGDYYNLLVDGFQEGHLHLKAEVHPNLLSPDPAVRSRAPYLLDAGLFDGRYYLYYGVVPAVLLLLPYSELTGHDLSLIAATLLSVVVGFTITLLWYRRVRERWFPHAPAVIDHVAVLLLAFGPATGFLVRRAMFYELPLATGYAFLAGFIFAITRALESESRRSRWMGLASTCVGFAAGCHPNYALLCVLVALTAWWIQRDEKWRWSTARASLIQLWACAVIPAASLGAALATYNYARFGDPLEFGFKYGLNVFFTTSDRLLGLDFIWPNLKWYYLTPPTLLPYFPFVFPADATFRPEGYHGAEPIHGQFLVSFTLLWIALGLLGRRATLPTPMVRLSLILAGAFAISAGFILLFGIRANRYLVDFQLPLVALSALGMLHASDTGTRARRLWQGGLLISAVALSVGNILAAVQQFDDFRNRRPQEFERLSRWANPSWALWERLGLVKTGTLVLEVTFKEQSVAVGEPLVTVGVPGYSDCVYAIQHPGNHVEFLIDHLGYGGPKSRLFAYEPGKNYRIEIELGSFYPPTTDPYFADSSQAAINHIKTRARVIFDGRTALNQSMALYDAAPWQREIGSNFTSHTAFSTRFSGRIGNPSWIPPRRSPNEDTAALRSAVLRFSIVVPDYLPAVSQPLVGFGFTGAGTLLHLRPESGNNWTLLVDEWGFAPAPGIPLTLPPGRHTVDLFVGPLLAFDPQTTADDQNGKLRAKRDKLLIWINGQSVGSFTLTRHLAAFGTVVPGANVQQFSTADPYFYGAFGQTDLQPDERTALLRAAADAP